MPTRRLTLLFLFASSTLLAACGQQEALTIAEKARYTAELIEPAEECNRFRLQLTATTPDDAAIDGTVRAARAAHCYRPDV